MKKLSLAIIAFVFMANMALAAVDITIMPVKTVFSEGDRLEFGYSITSSTSENIAFIPHISCPSMLVGIKQQERAMLTADRPYTGRHSGAIVDAEAATQECTASIEIISPHTTKEVKLRITTLPSFDFNMLSCKDNACTKSQRSFVKGDRIYLKGASDATATAIVKFPGGSSQRVSLPGSFVASQSGEYWVEVSAAKSGFKPLVSTAAIFVVEQAYTVPYAEFSSKAGLAVVRPVFKETALTSQIAATKTAPEVVSAQKAAPQKRTLKSFFRRITGFFTALF